MNPIIPVDTLQAAQADHQAWRARALRTVLVVIAIGGVPALVSLILDAVLRDQATSLLAVYSVTYVALVALVFVPGLGLHARAWLFFVLAYILASASFARVGLLGSGRLYLVLLPAVAIILLTPRAGFVCAGISLGVYALFAGLASAGALTPWVTEKQNPLDLAFWVEAGAALVMFLLTLTLLLERLVRRHIQTLALSGRMTEELERAYRAMEMRVRDRTRELGLLNSVAAVASGQVELGEVLRVSLERTMSAFGYEAGGAYGLDERTGTLVMLAHKGLSEAFARQMEKLPLERALAGKELSLEQPLMWDVEEYPQGEMRRFIEAEGLTRVIGVPLAARGRLVGGLVLNSRVLRQVSAEEGSLLIAVGQQIGLAMENARLLEAERLGREEVNRRREVAEGLRETLAVLNSNKPLQEALDLIISQACRLMTCDASSLMQLDPVAGTLRIRAACGLDLDQVSAVELSLGPAGSRRALAWRQPVTVPDVTAMVEWQKQESNPDFAEDL
ncbi:MAG TPA: GAF domain-containing protein, partial [Spirochaetia bacterium]|nr:GAF domain-containing protein [Spirochaetia bacterium]